MLFPTTAAYAEAPSDHFINWRHFNSSLGISYGIHDQRTATSIHQYTWDQNSRAADLYELRRPDKAITRATRADQSVIYARSDYIDGSWHTVMLSANRRDVPILTAVAASLSVGRAAPLSIPPNGRIAAAIDAAVALANDDPPAPVSQPVATSDTPRSTGTGFIVSAAGQILTNAHVVEGCTSLTFNDFPAEIVATSPDFDLALIAAKGLPTEAIANFAAAPARLNSDVTIAGYPLTNILSGLNVTRGSVSSMRGFGGDIAGMQITAPVQPGNSGGPVLAANGDVVGVVVAKLNAQNIADQTGDIPQNVNFAIRGEMAKLFLFQNGVEPKLGANDAAIPPEDIADQAARFTGLIECR